MTEQTADLSVARNDDRHRYDVTVGGEPAGFAAFREDGDIVVFTHTEVSPRWEGKGVGSELARVALDDVIGRGQRISPRCEFIAGYIERHPELQSHVSG